MSSIEQASLPFRNARLELLKVLHLINSELLVHPAA
jgi:hypothetical protein